MENNSLETKVNAAIVFRGDFTQIQQVKEGLVSIGIEIIYQKVVPAGTKLFITEEL